MTTVTPTRKNILIAQVARQTTTSSGIIIESARSVLDNETARVLAVGPEVEFVKVGDELLVDWAKGQVIQVDGEQRLIINEKDVVAILEKE